MYLNYCVFLFKFGLWDNTLPSRLSSITAEQQNLFEKGKAIDAFPLCSYVSFTSSYFLIFDLKKLLNAVAELEELKPIVQQKLEELNRKSRYQVNKGNNHHQNNLVGFSGQYSPANKQSFKAWGTNKVCTMYVLLLMCHSSVLVWLPWIWL